MSLPRTLNKPVCRSAEPAAFDAPVEFARTADLTATDNDDATVYSACIAVWDSPDSHGDSFTRGSIITDIPAAGIPLLVGHRRSDDPIGSVVALRNEDDGAYADVVFASTARGRDVETLVREGHYKAVSFAGSMLEGFDNPVTGGKVGTLARVDELSITAFPADAGAVFDIVRDALAAQHTDSDEDDENTGDENTGDENTGEDDAPAERTHNETRALLEQALAAHHGNDNRTPWAWVRDLTTSWVVYEVGEGGGLHKADYHIDDNAEVAISNVTEVKAQVEYVARTDDSDLAAEGAAATVPGRTAADWLALL